MSSDDEQERDGRFVTGGKPGPGRPKGSRNKLSEDFVKALADDFETGGEEAIRLMRTSDPGGYVKVVASLLPKHVEVKDVSLDELGRDELAAILDAVRTARAVRDAAGEGSRH